MMNVLRSLTIGLALMLSGCASQVGSHARERARVFAKLPNWSGQWEQFDVGLSGRDLIGSGISINAAGIFGVQPPYRPEWQTKLQSVTDVFVTCTWGFPGLMIGSPMSFEVLITPEETVLIFNQRETRHIYTDGQSLPPKEERWGSPWGTSVGHWEGETLVIETVATNATIIFGSAEHGFKLGPLSDQAYFIERIRMIDRNTLQDDIVIDDPVALTTTWKLTRQYHRVPNLKRLIVEDCRGNDRTEVVDGKMVIAPPR
jgi:hypothetical protein